MDMKSCEVKDFLQDTNRFLTETLQNEHLSSKAKSERDELVQRLSCWLSEPAGPYIDMSGSTKGGQSGEYVALNTNQDKSIDSKLYEEFPDLQVLHSRSFRGHSGPQEYRPSISIEHLLLPASKLRTVGQKFGALSRKEKFMGLFVERSIRCFVGILGRNLYLYNSEKDVKPATFINVQGFEARPAVTYFPKDSKKRDFGFEVVCPGKKSYQFLASSIREMEEWIACINEAGTQVIETQDCEDSPKKLPPKPKRLPSPPPNVNEAEEYDDIRGRNDDLCDKNEEYGDEIYYNIKDLGLIKEECAVPSTEEYQHSNSKHISDNELVYDDICPLNPGLYYNVKDQRTEETRESDNATKDTFGYVDDEDIYDDIGIFLNNSDIRYSNGVDTSNNMPNAAQKKGELLCNTKKNIVSEVISDVTDSTSDKSVSCVDNLYEPVENPRDE